MTFAELQKHKLIPARAKLVTDVETMEFNGTDIDYGEAIPIMPGSTWVAVAIYNAPIYISGADDTNTYGRFSGKKFQYFTQKETSDGWANHPGEIFTLSPKNVNITKKSEEEKSLKQRGSG